MTDEKIVQAENVADDSKPNETEVADSPSGDAEPSGADTATEVEATTEGGDGTSEEPEPFRHTIDYKSYGEDAKFELEYDASGNLTPDTTERLTQVLAKQGLEKVAQEKDALAKEADGRRLSAEARVTFLEGQLTKVQEEYRKPFEDLKAHPQIGPAVQRSGVKLPDPDRIKLESDRQQVDAQMREVDRIKFVDGVSKSLYTKHSHLTDEQFMAITERVNSSPLMRQLIGNQAKLSDHIADVSHEAEMVIAQMILEGKLPNADLEKAQADVEKARKETKTTRAEATTRAAVVSPLAGGRPAGVRGAEKEVDVTGWTSREYAAYLRDGTLPSRQ